MRRTASALGALTSAALLVLALPTGASAATGRLALNGTVYENPAGCYTPQPDPTGLFTVVNGTDAVAYVYDKAACEGNVVALVGPSSLAQTTLGVSVLIA